MFFARIFSGGGGNVSSLFVRGNCVRCCFWRGGGAPTPLRTVGTKKPGGLFSFPKKPPFFKFFGERALSLGNGGEMKKSLEGICLFFWGGERVCCYLQPSFFVANRDVGGSNGPKIKDREGVPMLGFGNKTKRACE